MPPPLIMPRDRDRFLLALFDVGRGSVNQPVTLLELRAATGLSSEQCYDAAEHHVKQGNAEGTLSVNGQDGTIQITVAGYDAAVQLLRPWWRKMLDRPWVSAAVAAAAGAVALKLVELSAKLFWGG